MKDPKKPKITKADYKLQQKVGSGPLDERAIKRSQDVMDANNVDFSPLATEFLNKLHNAIEQAKTGTGDRKKTIRRITDPVMQLKANATIFHYTLMGNLANIILGFLESVEEIDEKAIEIIEAHHITLSVIVSKQIKGDGGQYGQKLQEELKSVCRRYFQQKK